VKDALMSVSPVSRAKPKLLVAYYGVGDENAITAAILST